MKKQLLACLALFASTYSVKAAVTIDVLQIGGDIVVSGSGSLNITDLTTRPSNSPGGLIVAYGNILVVGNPGSAQIADISGPFPLFGFGNGSGFVATSNTGNSFGIALGPVLVMDAGYISGTPIAGTSIFSGKTYSSLGLSLGTCVYSWGQGVNADSLTVNIGSTAIPDAYWLGGAGTLWSGTNWATDQSGTSSSQGKVGSTTNVVFSADGAANQLNTVVDQDVTINSLTVNSDAGITSGTNTLTITNALNVNNGTLTLSGSAVINSASAIIGNLDTGTAGVTLDGAGTVWSNTNLMFVGGTGSNSTLVIQNGATMNTGGAVIGDSAGSVHNFASVSGTGSKWAITNGINVGGAGGNNTVVVENGGTIQSGGVILGDQSTSNGNSAVVTGTGSTWSTGLVYIGNNGSANTLTLSQGGVMDVQNNALVIGFASGSGSNTVSVSDAELKHITDLSVGYSGSSNTLAISNGGKVTNNNASIGSQTGANGNSVTVSGAGSLWTSTGTLYLGESGQGNSLTISSGGVVTVNGSSKDAVVGLNATSTGNTLTVTGSGSQFANAATIYVGRSGSGNKMEILNGGTVTGHNARIGGDATSNGNIVNVDGAGSLWSGDGTLRIGSNGSNNTLNITNGGTVQMAGNTFLGYTSSSQGNAVVVSGTGSTFHVGTLTIGLSGSNNGVTVTDGGALVSSSITLGANGGSAGTLNIGSVDLQGTAGTITATAITGGSGTAILNFNQTNATAFDPHLTGQLSVNQLGSGTTTLTGSSSYTGTTTIQNGTLVITGAVSDSDGVIGGQVGSNGAVTVSGSGTWVNSGTLTVGGSGTGTLSIDGSTLISSTMGIIGLASSANGTVTVSSGTWAIASNLIVAQSGTGTLNINGGTVTDSNGFIGLAPGAIGTVTVSGGTWASSGNLTVGNSGTGTLNISGNGVVSVGSGTGTLTLASQAGSAGTLNLGTGGAAGTLNVAEVTGGSGTAIVNFNHTGNYTFAPVLSGSLSVNQLGSGATILTGSSTYTGLTTVQSGTLIVNGSITSGVTVNGGVLGGSGIIGGNVSNSGLVSPGNSPGTLTIAGDYTQTSAGSLLIQIASPTVYDKLVIGGHASLGGTLQISFLGGYVPKVGQLFPFLTASSGVSGSFSTIDTGTVLDFTVNLGADGVTGSILATQGLFEDVPGLTPNQLAVARGLDKVLGSSRVADLVTYLDGVAIAKITQKLEQIVPTDLIPMFDASIATAQTQAFNLERRMEEIRGGATGFSASGLNLSDSHGTRSFHGDGKQLIGTDGKALEPAPISDRWGFFINGSGEFVDEQSTAIARGTDFSTGGITTGADYRLGDHAAVGLTAGYANTSSNGRADGTVKIDSGKLGLYATVFDRGFFLNGVVGGGLNSYDTKRPTLGGWARGDANGSDFNALLGTGYTYRKGAFSAGPIASLRYSWVGIDSFTESGSLAPLRISDQSESSLKSTTGLQASYAFGFGNIRITPQVRAQWQHEYLDTARGIGASFLPGGAFTVNGPEIGRDSLLLDAGATVQLTPTIGIYAYYTGDIGRGNYTSHAINGGVQWSF